MVKTEKHRKFWWLTNAFKMVYWLKISESKHADEKSKMRKHPERGQQLESPYAEPFENYLGVAPIRPGGTVIAKRVVLHAD